MLKLFNFNLQDMRRRTMLASIVLYFNVANVKDNPFSL